MYKYRAILHKDVSPELLTEIIHVKSAAWPFPFDQQTKWIRENIKDSDIHFLLLRRNKVVAYLNLIDIEIEVNKHVEKAFGVGNVCAIEKGNGFGNELMKHANKYIIDSGRIGLLFCKNNLIEFYVRSGWTITNKDNIVIISDNETISAMVLHHSGHVEMIKYIDKLF